jgi:phosphoribosylanthranilate isomerase
VADQVLVKICGLTREEDVDAAVAAGADLLGFITVPESPRAVTAERAAELAARAPAGVRTVMVAVPGTAKPDSCDLLQVYDVPENTNDVILGFRGPPPAGVPDGVPLLLDLARDSAPEIETLRAHWAAARAVRRPVVLAGSLTPGNVAEAVQTARPWAVDTARGVESAPGIKDHDLIGRFVQAAKGAA